MLDSLPVEIVETIAAKLQDEGDVHPLRPPWLTARDRAALAMSCRNGMLALRASQPVGAMSRRRMLLHAKDLFYSHNEAAAKFMLSRKQMAEVPCVRRQGRKLYRDVDLVPQATAVWGTPEAFDAERKKREWAREFREAVAVKRLEEERAARLRQQQKRVLDVQRIAEAAGYTLVEWQQEEIEEYSETGRVDGHPATPQELFDRMRIRRYQKETDWWAIHSALVRTRQAGSFVRASFMLLSGFKLTDHICVARWLRECMPEHMLPPELAELGQWMVRHKMDTGPIELKVSL